MRMVRYTAMRPAPATGPATGPVATRPVAGRVLAALVTIGLLAAAFPTFRALADVDPRGRASWTGVPPVFDATPRDVRLFLPACDVAGIELHPAARAEGRAEVTAFLSAPDGAARRAASWEYAIRGDAPIRVGDQATLAAAPWRAPLVLRIASPDSLLTLTPRHPITLDTSARGPLGTFACAFDGGSPGRAWSVAVATLVMLAGTGVLAAGWIGRAFLAHGAVGIPMRAAPWLAAALVSATTLVYLFVVPAFEPPDELAHFQYARFVATTGALPREVPHPASEWRASSYEWVQQPLYYLGAAMLVRGAGWHSPGPVLEMNPRSRLRPGGTEPTIFHHGEPRGDRTAHRALLTLRAVSLLMAIATAWLLARLVRTVTADPLVVASVAGGLALIPQWCAVMGAVSTDPPATMLAAAATLAIVRVAHGRIHATWLLITGLLIGAAYAVKATAVFLVPMALLACAADAANRAAYVIGERPRAGYVRLLADALAPMLLVLIGIAVAAGWIHVRALLVFGDPQAFAFKKAVLEAGGFVPVAGPMPWSGEFWAQMRTMVFEPFWARFGSLGAGPFPGSQVWNIYGAASALLATIALGGLWAWTRAGLGDVRRGAGGEAACVMLAVGVCGLGLGVGLGAWVGVNLVPRADMVVHWTPRHILPLTAPAALLVAAGLERLRHASPRVRRAGHLLVGLTMAATAVAGLGVLRATVLMFHFGY